MLASLHRGADLNSATLDMVGRLLVDFKVAAARAGTPETANLMNGAIGVVVETAKGRGATDADVAVLTAAISLQLTEAVDEADAKTVHDLMDALTWMSDTRPDSARQANTEKAGELLTVLSMRSPGARAVGQALGIPYALRFGGPASG